MTQEMTGEEDISDGERGILAEIPQWDVGIAGLLQLVLWETQRETMEH